MKLSKLGSNQTEIELSDGTRVLFSYETPVAAYIPGEGYYKTSERYSVTTSKHVERYVVGDVKEKPQEFFNSLVK